MFEFEEKVVESSAGDKYLNLVLSGDVSIENIATLKELLLKVFAEYPSVVLDVGQVTSADFVMLQLLCATNQYALASKRNFELKNSKTEVFKNNTKVLGFLHNAGCCGPQQCLWMTD